MSFKNGVTGDQHSFARLAPFWNIPGIPAIVGIAVLQAGVRNIRKKHFRYQIF